MNKVNLGLSVFIALAVLSSCKKKEVKLVTASDEVIVDECFVENDIRDEFLNTLYRVDIPDVETCYLWGYTASISQSELNSGNRKSIYFKFLKGIKFIDSKIAYFENLSNSGVLSESDLEYFNEFKTHYESNKTSYCKNLYFQPCDSMGKALISSSVYQLSNLKREYVVRSNKIYPVTPLANLEDSFRYIVNFSTENCEGHYI